MSDPDIFLALDTSCTTTALNLLGQIENLADVKIGLEFFIANGIAGTNLVRNAGLPSGKHRQLFLDLKLHDIPTTMHKAIVSCLVMEPSFITVHLAAGKKGLEASLEAAGKADLKGYTKPRILAVTTLTSTVAASGWEDELCDKIMEAKYIGVDGVVCPAIGPKLCHFDNFYYMTPGIRMELSDAHDQQHVYTPREAMNMGSSGLVIGREVTLSNDPKQTLMDIRKSLD